MAKTSAELPKESDKKGLQVVSTRHYEAPAPTNLNTELVSILQLLFSSCIASYQVFCVLQTKTRTCDVTNYEILKMRTCFVMVQNIHFNF